MFTFSFHAKTKRITLVGKNEKSYRRWSSPGSGAGRRCASSAAARRAPSPDGAAMRPCAQSTRLCSRCSDASPASSPSRPRSICRRCCPCISTTPFYTMPITQRTTHLQLLALPKVQKKTVFF